MENIRVILAEDHAIVRQGTRNLLDREPDISVVAEAATGREAVAAVEHFLPDIAILDVAMPDMNGIEATKMIRKDHPEVNILVLTAYDDDEYVFAFMDAGAAGYLLKDVPAIEVVRAIRAIHSGDPVLHPTIMKKLMQRMSGHSDSARNPDDTAHNGLTEELLSERELQVLRLAAEGLTNVAIADSLELSPRTVQTHLRNVFNKLNVSSRTQAVVTAMKRGLVKTTGE